MHLRRPLHRATALLIVGLLVGPLVGLVPACGDSGAGPESPPDLGPRSSLSATDVAQMRAACAFGPGAWPGSSIEKGAPIGPEMPIDTVVIIMAENRSFDHLLGDLPAAGQSDVEVPAPGASNTGSDGKVIPWHHATQMCFSDTNHEWQGSHREWNGGKNDGFAVANETAMLDGSRAMTFYTAADVPFVYGLATTFAIADHFHCSLLGPTWPNRDYLYAGTSFGNTGNKFPTTKVQTLFTRLDDANVDWHAYYTTMSIPGLGTLGSAPLAHLDVLSTFYTDAKAGLLAPVVLVDPDLADKNQAAKTDFHPPGDVQLGDQFLDQIISTLMQSPQWPRMAIFVTFDEHGGIFDHVPPPAACPPDDIPPDDNSGGLFDRLGFRVPLIAISPYAKAHYVSHRTYDLTSITRFVETRFLLPALTKRDANADPLLDLFDFSSARFATPPQLPRSKVDQAKLDECLALFPPQK